MQFVFDVIVPLQTDTRYLHQCVSVPRHKKSEHKPYIGKTKQDHTARTHVQVYFSTIMDQMRWITDNSFITIGDTTFRQLMLPQGARGSPPLAIALGIQLVWTQRQRLLSVSGHTELPTLTPTEWPLAPQNLRVARLFSNCIRQYIDDVGVLLPILENVPTTRDDADMLMDLLESQSPELTLMPTFPHPLSLEQQLDAPGSWAHKYLETYVKVTAHYASLQHFQKDLDDLKDDDTRVSHMQDSRSHLLSTEHWLPMAIGGFARAVQCVDIGQHMRQHNASLALIRTAESQRQHGIPRSTTLRALDRRHSRHLRNGDISAVNAVQHTLDLLRNRHRPSSIP